MTALAAVADVEAGLGVPTGTLSVTEAAQVTGWLATLTGYISEQTGHNWGSTTATVRCQADGNGEIYFIDLEPVTAVTTVTDFKTGAVLDPTLGSSAYYFDGLATVYGLYPRQVVDVALTYGETTVPDSLKGLAVAVVVRAFQNPKNLTSRTVADAAEVYPDDDGSALSLTKQEEKVLSRWTDTETTWSLGIRADYPDPREFRGATWPNGPYL